MIQLVRKEGETAKGYAYRFLRENIVAFQLEPGTCLNDLELSRSMGISRTPLREAIQKLNEESKIIEIYPQKGSWISLIDEKRVQEAQFMRVALEQAVLVRLCDTIVPENFEELERMVVLQKFYVESANRQAFFDSDNEFHYTLYKFCGLEMTYQFQQGMAIHYDRVRCNIDIMDRASKIIRDHKAIPSALKIRNKTKVRRVLEEHIKRGEEDIARLKEKYPQYFVKT